MNVHWKGTLEKVCEIYFQSDTKIDWILVGSAGSVLQGCIMEPGDIDIYVKHKEGVSQFAELLNQFSLSTKCTNRNSNDWLSSIEEPVFEQIFPSGFSWTKARWEINSCNVEVVHISNSAGIPDSLTGDGIWEGGKYIWNLSKNVRIGEYLIPTVPLEIQLESNIRRKRQDRIASILQAMGNYGYDMDLAKTALSSQNLTYFYSEMGLSS
ncbi:nucleotidyltransferase family protein [Bacillus niameyensis]|uniref:hypothetical protein n=1 Tax=Bacillus niameyensis TaxID=1522308 RepID=UPI000784C1F4|nr:hypothetical protein [Bacillus niameyensis]